MNLVFIIIMMMLEYLSSIIDNSRFIGLGMNDQKKPYRKTETGHTIHTQEGMLV